MIKMIKIKYIDTNVHKVIFIPIYRCLLIFAVNCLQTCLFEKIRVNFIFLSFAFTEHLCA